MPHSHNTLMVSVKIGSPLAQTMAQLAAKQKRVHLLLADSLPMIQLHVKCISQPAQALLPNQAALIRHAITTVMRLPHLLMLIVVVGSLIALPIHQIQAALITRLVLMLL